MTKREFQDRNVRRRARGFMQTGGLLAQPIRNATEKRGFAEARLLTHWAEIVGQETADMARPVKVGYGRQGIGATLTLLTNGANAPMLQAELPRIRDRVNACYGYAAISRIHLTQTSETGFAEDQASFTPGPAARKRDADPRSQAQLEESLEDFTSDGLRSALAVLGQNILTRSKD